MERQQDIISKIKFLGRLKKGDKIHTRHMYVQPAGIVTMLSRTFISQDNRANALHFAQDAIYRAFDLLSAYESSNESRMGKNLVTDIEKSIHGLENLKSTYIEDTKFYCDMDTLIEQTQNKLDKCTWCRSEKSNNSSNAACSSERTNRLNIQHCVDYNGRTVSASV